MKIVDSHQDLSVKTVLSEFLCLVLLICRENDNFLLLQFLEKLLFNSCRLSLLHSFKHFVLGELGVFLSLDLDLPLYLRILILQALIRS